MRALRLIAVCWSLAWASAAFSMDLDPNEIRGSSSKEPVDVLQNRYFLKAWRPEVGLIAGSVLNEAYINTRITGLRAGMFFTEWAGVEAQYMRTTVSSSADAKTLEKLQYRPLTGNGITTVRPEVDAIHSVSEVNAIGAPLYGKLNILNQFIVYTDIYFTGGLAEIGTDQGNKTALALGLGERFYLGKSWSIRLDFKDRIFNETRGGSPSQRNAESVDIGVGYFIK